MSEYPGTGWLIISNVQTIILSVIGSEVSTKISQELKERKSFLIFDNGIHIFFSGSPQEYKLTKPFLPADQFSTVIDDFKPSVPYVFQVLKEKRCPIFSLHTIDIIIDP